MLQIMMEQKKPERNDITLSGEKLRKYFPRSYSPQRIEETIFKLLDAWMRKRSVITADDNFIFFQPDSRFSDFFIVRPAGACFKG